MTLPTSITVRVPLKIRRRAGRKTVVTPAREGAPAIVTRADPALVKALARAFRYQRLLDEGRYASISEMAAAEKIERGYLGTLLRLTLLTPDLIEAILDGRQPEGLTLPALMEPLPTEWTAQHMAIDNGTPPVSEGRRDPRRPRARWARLRRTAQGRVPAPYSSSSLSAASSSARIWRRSRIRTEETGSPSRR
ncbi:hypothetical protein [Siccirubricoccus soli]|uniref:hypothetical protein n=1 Tax=Siccirubricoccus soli TaxID=2899147 RepID=UPI00351980ED